MLKTNTYVHADQWTCLHDAEPIFISLRLIPNNAIQSKWNPALPDFHVILTPCYYSFKAYAEIWISAASTCDIGFRKMDPLQWN